jgi:hypothetical protein
MLNISLVMNPNIERIVDMDFSPPKNSQNLSLDDAKSLYLNSEATHLLLILCAILVSSQSCIFGALMSYEHNFKKNMIYLILLRMIVFLPLHQRVARHKVIIW